MEKVLIVDLMLKFYGVPANRRIKLKEREKKDKYLDLAREFKKNSTNCCFALNIYIISQM